MLEVKLLEGALIALTGMVVVFTILFFLMLAMLALGRLFPERKEPPQKPLGKEAPREKAPEPEKAPSSETPLAEDEASLVAAVAAVYASRRASKSSRSSGPSLTSRLQISRPAPGPSPGVRPTVLSRLSRPSQQSNPWATSVRPRLRWGEVRSGRRWPPSLRDQSR